MEIKRKKEFLIHCCYMMVMMTIGYLTVRYILIWISPFLIAFGIATVLQPCISILEKHLPLQRKTIAYGMVGFFFCGIGIGIFYLWKKTVQILPRLFQELPWIYQSIYKPFLQSSRLLFERILPFWKIGKQTVFEMVCQQMIGIGKEAMAHFSATLVGTLPKMMMSLPNFFFYCIMTVLSTFLMVSDYKRIDQKIEKFALQLFYGKKRVLDCLKRCLKEGLFAYGRAYLLLAITAFLQLWIGFWLLSVQYPAVLAMIVALLDGLPGIGVGGVLFPWIFVSILQRQYQFALGLGILLCFISVVRSLLEPRFIGKQFDIHPLLLLCGMLLGQKIFGIGGMFLAPFMITFWTAINKEGEKA